MSPPPPFGANSAAARDIANVLHPYTDLKTHQEVGPVVISRGKGVTVHLTTCPTVVNEREIARLIDVEWEAAPTQTYPIAIRVEAYDLTGLLSDITQVMAENRVNILAANVGVNPDHETVTTWVVRPLACDTVSVRRGSSADPVVAVADRMPAVVMQRIETLARARRRRCIRASPSTPRNDARQVLGRRSTPHPPRRTSGTPTRSRSLAPRRLPQASLLSGSALR